MIESRKIVFTMYLDTHYFCLVRSNDVQAKAAAPAPRGAAPAVGYMAGAVR